MFLAAPHDSRCCKTASSSSLGFPWSSLGQDFSIMAEMSLSNFQLILKFAKILSSDLLCVCEKYSSLVIKNPQVSLRPIMLCLNTLLPGIKVAQPLEHNFQYLQPHMDWIPAGFLSFCSRIQFDSKEMPNTTIKQIQKLNFHHQHQAKDTFGVIAKGGLSNLLVFALKILCEGLSPLFCEILIFELNSNYVVPCL